MLSTPEIESLPPDDPARWLLSLVRQHLEGVAEANTYSFVGHPVFQTDDGERQIAEVVVVGPTLGVLLFGQATDSEGDGFQEAATRLKVVCGSLMSRFHRNPSLQVGTTGLVVTVKAALFSVLASGVDAAGGIEVVSEEAGVRSFLKGATQVNPYHEDVLLNVVATLQGATGLSRPKPRPIPPERREGKAARANRIEGAISVFDKKQFIVAREPITGVTRLRGIAGSGKTVVLAMCAALAHLDDPTQSILFTFWTKSLYQNVRRQIDRFFKQFSDQDVNWDRVHVLHGWGGANFRGVYSDACARSGRRAIPFSEASAGDRNSPFAFACKDLLASRQIAQSYDLILIDEGQDFPSEFFDICEKLVRDDRLVLAYDQFQNVFNTKMPKWEELFSKEVSRGPDRVLKVCYRNPREILVCAHAIGLGVYGSGAGRIQVLEDEEHWEDIGYKLTNGELKPGSIVTIERLAETTPLRTGALGPATEIVKGVALKDMNEEVASVVAQIKDDLADGLRPEDILVVSVDDRNAKEYLTAIGDALARDDIQSQSPYAVGSTQQTFSKAGRVTLSTVYRAKGNEALMVYVVGVDSCYPNPDVRDRNRLFTAMTRAKAWLRLSGVAPAANQFLAELKKAQRHSPALVFEYPPKERQLPLLRDLAEEARRRQDAEAKLEELLDGDLTPEDIQKYLKRRRQQQAKRLKP